MRGSRGSSSLLDQVPDFHIKLPLLSIRPHVDKAVFTMSNNIGLHSYRHDFVTARVDTPVFGQLVDQLEIDP